MSIGVSPKVAIDLIQELITKNKVNDKLQPSPFFQGLIEEVQKKKQLTTTEELLPYVANLLTAWSCYVLEAKSICHYRKPEARFRQIRDQYIPTLHQGIIGGRNIGVQEKRTRQAEGDQNRDFDVPPNITIPENYTEETMFSTDQPTNKPNTYTPKPEDHGVGSTNTGS